MTRPLILPVVHIRVSSFRTQVTTLYFASRAGFRKPNCRLGPGIASGSHALDNCRIYAEVAFPWSLVHRALRELHTGNLLSNIFTSASWVGAGGRTLPTTLLRRGTRLSSPVIALVLHRALNDKTFLPLAN